MKKLDIPHGMEKRFKNQETVMSICDDLITIIESYTDEFEMNEVFYHCIRFLTQALYDSNSSHQEALKVLRMAMDHGIQASIDKGRH